MAGRYGRPFVYANPQQRFLRDSPTLTVALKELSRILHYSDLIVCNLSCSGLTLELARELPQYLQQLKRLYALDLSSNYITTTQWQDVYDLAATFLLNDNLVQFLDLGLNYLPLLQSLVEDPAMLEKFKVFGSRLRQALCVLRLAGLRRRACVGWETGLSGRGRLLWGNQLLQGPMIMRLNSLGTCTTRSGPSAQYGKMSHRALSFTTPLPLLAGPCWSALSHGKCKCSDHSCVNACMCRR